VRLGGPLADRPETPANWAAAVKKLGYSAAFCPVGDDADADTIAAYARAAAENDIVIAEVGAWSSPLNPEPAKAAEALALCKRRLALADAIGARCCVNIAGSRGQGWDGPCAQDLTDETFERIVAMVQQLLDDVRPTRTYYTLETMPWMFPDSTESYQRLIEAIDRERFAVHFDPVNLINTPRRYFDTAAVIREFVARLGPHIRSCHAKDTRMSKPLTVQLREVRPGTGNLDYATFLREIDTLDPDTPVMLEHLDSPQEYAEAAAYIRQAAASEGVTIR